MVEPIPREVLQLPDMRLALAGRDIAAAYKILGRNGVSQRRIAAVCDQSQSEISEILAGRRVRTYDVFLRICLGLEVPRAWMGLAYDEETVEIIVRAGHIAPPQRATKPPTMQVPHWLKT